MRRPRPDLPSLVAGLTTTLLGAVLLLDRLEVIDLRVAGFVPLACAAVGAVLVATGLTRRES
jgi:hypothetical protein